MKRRFTILTAALALLVSLAIPMGVWGQTKGTVTDNMTAADLAATGTSYTAFSNVSLTSDAVYAGKSALNNNANIQLRSSGSDCGIVTTVSGGKIKSITINVASGSNTIDVYGKNTAYTSAAQLFNSTNQGTKLGSVSSTGTITVSGDYEYVGIRSYNGAVYISSIALVWETTGSSVTATTVTIDDTGITNTDVYTSTIAGSLSATVKENANNTVISGVAVTWSSSNTNIATIDNSGAVTLVAAGTTTITASYAGESGVYGSSSATYELIVTSSEPYVQPTTIEIIPNYEFWGKTGQFSGSTYSELEGSKDNVTLYWTRGSGSTYANLTAMRFYKDNNLTFTAPEGYEITSIVITFTSAQSDLSFSPGDYSLSGTTGTWTGSSATVTMSRPSDASSYAQISKFTITLAPIGSAVTTTTTINVPQNFNTDIYQGTNAGTLTATVKDNDDNAISGATVIWSSNNTGVATIDANGAVTLVAVGTTTITASYAGVEDIYRPSSATYELTVTNSAPAMLPFVWQGGSSAAFLALNGVSAQGLGGDYAETHAPYLIKLDGTGDYIQVKCDQRPGKVTIGVMMLGGSNSSTITIQGSADGETFTDIEELTISGEQYDVLTLETTNAFAATDRYVRMLFTKGSNVGVGPITIAKLYPLTITGYGTGTGNWYLIASPIGDVAPTNVTNMLSNSYDLYYFDQDTDGYGNEWINYKGDANTNTEIGSFGLEIGKGYLYANSEDVDLIFTGICPATESTYPVQLKRNKDARFAGWNLVGNPYADIAYFADNRDFYTMNSTATAFELIGAEDARHIQAMEGVFVTAEENNEEVVFTTTAPAKTGNRLALNLSQGNNVIDRAFIRFGECRQLPKLQFNRNSTKLYIPMDAEDYAVVRGEEMGEMPVNFKAESNGTYSLNFGMDNVEFAYLHLIDNLTGNEVDLLQTPSYSFEAKTTDYESRFKLVFATGDNSNEDNFAYFSNGSFVINNEGNATLQVIDITGRIVKCESINGCANVNVNTAPGVYMLRLVNGDNVKVQKVVVK